MTRQGQTPARSGPPAPGPNAGGVRPGGAPPAASPARTPVDPSTLPNAATASVPANQDTMDGIFPGHVRNDSNERIYVLVGGTGWMYLDPGQSTASGIDVDGVLHRGGFRKIAGSNTAIVTSTGVSVEGLLGANYGDWRPGAAATDSNGNEIIAPGQIMDGRRDAFGFDSWFAPR